MQQMPNATARTEREQLAEIISLW